MVTEIVVLLRAMVLEIAGLGLNVRPKSPGHNPLSKCSSVPQTPAQSRPHETIREWLGLMSSPATQRPTPAVGANVSDFDTLESDAAARSGRAQKPLGW